MEIRILYPIRREERNYDKDWDVRVSYKNEFPTKANIEKDYKELPISETFWKDSLKRLLDFDSGEHLLETIFHLLNMDETNPMSTDDMQDWIRANKVSHTSMSVGDIIMLDNNIYVCADEGWKEIKE